MNNYAQYQFFSISKLQFAFILMAGILLASCQTNGLNIDSGTDASQTTPRLTENPSGEVYGHGRIRVALLIPKTAPGNGAKVAQEILNGALMALEDFGQNTVQLVVKDTVGQPTTAQTKASEAVGEGASIILGPLFSESVSNASAMTQPVGRPIIAFSTDASIAKRGVYLLSFTPQDDVRRIISYAASQGKRSIIAFLPSNAYGAVVEGTLRQVAGRSGVEIVHIARYERSGEGIEAAVRDAAVFYENADTVYIPEGGNVPSAILGSIKRMRLPMADKQILGSGRWESVKLGDRLLSGAIYPGRDITKFDNFSARYEVKYGVKPGVNAALGHDAVTLTIELVRNNRQRAFKANIIENANGFAGINGIFRFRKQGTAERGLAIYRVTNGLGQLLVPAPTSFGFGR
ncbi:MAG: penicillin-binding protein activator [Hyphomicrobiales bacterium]|nr:penicillin-binding protein activator [Hyphomicrobiales bacterium]